MAYPIMMVATSDKRAFIFPFYPRAGLLFLCSFLFAASLKCAGIQAQASKNGLIKARQR
jgi:hypothetical protein